MSPLRKRNLLPILAVAFLTALPLAGLVLRFLEVFQNDQQGVEGLDGAVAVTVSPDGQHVYVAARDDDSIAVFRYASGALEYVGAIQDGDPSVFGLDGPSALASSPEGARLYATASVDDTLVVFARDATAESLALVDLFQDGVGGVEGLDGASDVAVSPDGRHLYVTGRSDAALAIFRRDATTESVAYAGLEENGGQGVWGLGGAAAVSVSPGGTMVAVAGSTDDALVLFARDATTDDLTFLDAVYSPHPLDIAFSPDDQDVYVVSAGDRAIHHYRHLPSTLELVAMYLLGSDVTPRSLVLSPDGAVLLASVQLPGGHALLLLERSSLDGSLSFGDVAQEGQNGVYGIQGIVGLALRGQDVLTAAATADAVARFSVLPEDIFADGFESGDTSSWSSTAP